MDRRTTEAWLHALHQTGPARAEAFADLREYLRRAVFLYLRDKRTDLSDISPYDLYQMAEDFAQEAIIAIEINLDSFQGRSKFTTWAYRFVVNKAIDELRRRHYRGRLSLDELESAETAVFSELLETSPQTEPSQMAEREDILNQIQEIIRIYLNDRQRLALLGVYLQGRSIQEVAEALDTSPNTVYKILYDARRKLRDQLEARRLSGGDILALFEE